MEYLAHSASFQLVLNNAPSKPGIKHLATPGLDAHAIYVALSRHRDGIALHYGRDDFAEASQLRRTLSRERPKDMAMDYAARGEGRSGGSGQANAATAEGRTAPTDRVNEPPAARVAPDRVIAIGAPGSGANTERAAAIRAMIEARLNAPAHTAESMREAMAAARAAPAAEVAPKSPDRPSHLWMCDDYA